MTKIESLSTFIQRKDQEKENGIVNEAKTKAKQRTMEELATDLMNANQWKKREIMVAFVKGFYMKLNPKSKNLHDDINVWNITSYVNKMYKQDLGSSPKAKAIIQPLLLAIEGMKDYSSDVINDENAEFKKIEEEDAKAYAKIIESDERLKKVFDHMDYQLSKSDGVTILFEYFEQSDADVIDMKVDSKEFITLLTNSFGKMYDNFEVKKGGRGTVTMRGHSKLYIKRYAEIRAKWAKKIKSIEDKK